MFVLGIDPGLSRCGYGCVEARPRPRAVSAGVVTTAADTPLPERLAQLKTALRLLIAELRPDVVAVERVLFQTNARTAMAVGQASGLALAEAAGAGCVVVEYSPNEVKQAVAGYGGATKEQVQRMVQMQLGLAAPPRPPDVADALALALCHVAVAPLAARVREAQVAAGAAPRRSDARRKGAEL